MATTYPDEPAALPVRVWSLERNEQRTADTLAHIDERIGELEQVKATFAERFVGLSLKVERLEVTLNRVLWALVTLSLTIAGSSIGVMLTFGSH